MSNTPRTDEAADYTAPEKLHSLCKDLERELAAVKAERDALLEARAWRPIADGLPCFGVDVIVFSEDEYGRYQSVAQLETPSEGAPEGWINWNSGDGTATNDDAWTRGTITHWMPLPEPPKVAP